jgi:hypothetical protein
MPLTSIIAVVFDFDDTLIPDTTTLLLQEHRIDPTAFWDQVKKLVMRGYDHTLAYLKLLLERVGRDKPLGLLTNADLRQFGSGLDKHFHPGLPQLFDDLQKKVAKKFGITVEFYIVSGGLQAIIEGSQIVKKYFTAIYGCLLEEAGSPPILSHIKRAITFTEKTRYLFEIHKGLNPAVTRKNPYLVNKYIHYSKRRIPFENMIYIGDGYTDIPCLSLLNEIKGVSFGVFDPSDETKAKHACTPLWAQG